MEEAQSREGIDGLGVGSPHSRAQGPRSHQQRGQKRERISQQAWQADVDACKQILLDLWGRDEDRGEAWVAAYRTLDSLAGAGPAKDFVDFLNSRARQIDMGG